MISIKSSAGVTTINGVDIRSETFVNDVLIGVATNSGTDTLVTDSDALLLSEPFDYNSTNIASSFGNHGGLKSVLGEVTSLSHDGYTTADTITAHTISSTKSTPNMTSNVLPSGVASASTEYSATFPAWKAFSGVNATSSDCWVTASTTSTGYLQYEFPTAVAIVKYGIESRAGRDNGGNAPKDWTITASVTGSFTGEEVLLDLQKDQIFNANAQLKEYNMSNITAYKFYRINITKNNGLTVYTIIGRMIYYEYNAGTVATLVGAAGSYPLNPFRGEFELANMSKSKPIPIIEVMSANSSAGQVATASSIYNGTYDAWKAFNGTTQDNTDCWHTKSTDSNLVKWVAVELATAQTPTSYIIQTRNNATAWGATSFKIQGSNNGIDWTTLDTWTGATWKMGELIYGSFTNTTAYLHLRIFTEIIDTATYFCVGNLQIFKDALADTLLTHNNITNGDKLVIVKDDDSLNEITVSGVTLQEENDEWTTFGTNLTKTSAYLMTKSAGGNSWANSNAYGSAQINGNVYFEIERTSTSNTILIGVSSSPTYQLDHISTLIKGHSYYSSNGNYYNLDASVTYGETWTNGDRIGVRCDSESGDIEFYKNGVSQGVIAIGPGVWYPAISLYAINATATLHTANGTVLYQPEGTILYPGGYNKMSTTSVTAGEVPSRVYAVEPRVSFDLDGGYIDVGIYSASYVLNTKQYRYVRCWSNGSSGNTSNHWVEIQAIELGTGTNRAAGLTATGSTTVTSPANLTNSLIQTGAYTSVGSGSQYVQLDLGAQYSLEKIRVLHYFGDKRTYKDTKTLVSSDGVNWVTLYDYQLTDTYMGTRDYREFYVQDETLSATIDYNRAITSSVESTIPKIELKSIGDKMTSLTGSILK